MKRKKCIENTERRIRNIWNLVKRYNMHAIRDSEERRNRMKQKDYLKKIDEQKSSITMNFKNDNYKDKTHLYTS